MNTPNHTGKVAIISGASSGIGRATALALANQRMRLALNSRSQPDLEEVARMVDQIGGEALVHAGDLSEPETSQRLVGATVERWGKVDILVLSHGQYIHGAYNETSVAAMEHALKVNFYGAYHLVQATLPEMVSRRAGHLIFISSMIAKKALPNDLPYVVSKFALSGFADALRQELFRTDLAVTTIFPARIATRMIADLDLSPMARPAPAESVAGAVLKGLRTRQPEIVLPFKSNALVYLSVLSPRLADWAVRYFRLETRIKHASQLDLSD